MTDYRDTAEALRKDYAELERRDFLAREQRPDPRASAGMVLAVRIAQAIVIAALLGGGYVAGWSLVLVAVQLGVWAP